MKANDVKEESKVGGDNADDVEENVKGKGSKKSNAKGGKKNKNADKYAKIEEQLAQEDIAEVSGKNVSKRMKHNQQKEYAQKLQTRDDKKMVQQHENSVEHRWINLTEKRGLGQTIIPHKFAVESIEEIDAAAFLNVTLNVSRKFVPIGTPAGRYFVAAGSGEWAEDEEVKASEGGIAGERGNQKGIKIKGSGSLSQSPCGGSGNNCRSRGAKAKGISTVKKFFSSVALQHTPFPAV